jgi:hypothetical protein
VLVPCHVTTQWLWFSIRLIEGINTHSGWLHIYIYIYSLYVDTVNLNVKLLSLVIMTSSYSNVYYESCLNLQLPFPIQPFQVDSILWRGSIPWLSSLRRRP